MQVRKIINLHVSICQLRYKLKFIPSTITQEHKGKTQGMLQIVPLRIFIDYVVKIFSNKMNRELKEERTFRMETAAPLMHENISSSSLKVKK